MNRSKRVALLLLFTALLVVLILPIYLFSPPSKAGAVGAVSYEVISSVGLRDALDFASASQDIPVDIYIMEPIQADYAIVIHANTFLHIVSELYINSGNGISNYGVIHLYGIINLSNNITNYGDGKGIVYPGSQIRGNSSWVTSGGFVDLRGDEYWTIVFDACGGTFESGRTEQRIYIHKDGRDGFVLSPPDIPGKHGSIFDRWDWDFSRPVNSDMTIYALWFVDPTITPTEYITLTVTIIELPSTQVVTTTVVLPGTTDLVTITEPATNTTVTSTVTVTAKQTTTITNTVTRTTTLVSPLASTVTAMIAHTSTNTVTVTQVVPPLVETVTILKTVAEQVEKGKEEFSVVVDTGSMAMNLETEQKELRIRLVTESSSCALLNLLFCASGALMAVLSITWDVGRCKRYGMMALALATGMAGLVLFFVTQNPSGIWKIADMWSIIHACILLVGMAASFVVLTEGKYKCTETH